MSEQLNALRGSPAEREKAITLMLFNAFQGLSWLPKTKTLIGIGGSFRNIGKIDKKRRAYPLEITHNYHLTGERFLEIHQLIRNTPQDSRKGIKGLSADRADIIWGATTAIQSVIAYCGITDIQISGYGLREGLIFEQILPDRKPVESVLEFSLDNLIANFDLNKKHAYHVWRLCEALFEQLKPVHGIKLLPDKILKTSALLHDCGITISYYDHHLHSLYIILNSLINGLSHREILMAAYIAAYHRKNSIKINDIHKNLLHVEDIQALRKLGIILKIAEALDRRMNSNVENIECIINPESVTLRIQSRGGHELESIQALEVLPAFLKVFGKKLFVL